MFAFKIRSVNHRIPPCLLSSCLSSSYLRSTSALAIQRKSSSDGREFTGRRSYEIMRRSSMKEKMIKRTAGISEKERKDQRTSFALQLDKRTMAETYSPSPECRVTREVTKPGAFSPSTGRDAMTFQGEHGERRAV